MANIQLKRIYESADANDGFRILVDRLWPRGVSKAEAKIDLWLKEIAPTTELRQDFHDGEDTWPEFERAYRKELHDNSAMKDLLEIVKNKETVTLLFGSKDVEHNQAVVLADELRKAL